jgi:putative protease
VVFDLGKPDQQEPGGRLWAVEALGPNEALIRLDVDFDSSNIPNGCRVWKTDDPVVKKELEQSYQNDPIYHRVPVHVKAVGNVGGALTIFLSDDTGLRVEVSWLGPLEVPRKHPFNGELLREQFDRLGDTPFQLGRAEIDCPQPVLVPKSILNDLRRQAVQKLCELRIAREAKAIAEPEALKTLRSEIPKAKPSTRPPSITVLVRNLDQLAAVLEDAESVSMVYCDFEDLRKYKEAVPLARAREIPIGLAPLRIQKPGEEGFLSPILHAQPDAVLIRNLAALLYFQEKLPSARLIGDFSLNVANELTAAFFVKSGLERLIPSFDLNWEQFQALMRRVPVEWFEPVIHQHMPMFHMEHCVFAAFLSNGRDFRDCGRPCDDHKVELRDRVNADFPVIPDTGCRNTVYNSQAQSAIEYLPQMQALGLSRFRIDLLRERGTEVQSLLTTYRRVLAGQEDGKETWKKLRVMNQLGVTRGTLKLV